MTQALAGILISFVIAGCSASPPAAATVPATAASTSAGPSTVPTSGPTAAATAVIPVLPGESWIAYQCYDRCGGSFRIMLVRPDGSGNHWALPDVPGDQQHPDWSPDGQRLAFVVGGAIWVADVDGSDARAVYTCATPCYGVDNPAWSPDGKSIAFIRYDDVQGSGRAFIEILDVGAGSVRDVYQTDGPIFPFYVRWAPDAKSLVVDLQRYVDSLLAAAAETGGAIATLDLTVKKPEPHRLTDWALFATYPDWSPDGSRIVFSTLDLGARDSGNAFPDVSLPSDLYTIRPDGTALTQLTTNAHGSTLIRNGTASGPLSTQPTWAPDGRSIIFVQVDGTEWPGWEMASMLADGTGIGPATTSGYMFGTHPRLRPGA
ncbi:MAG: PD40 domain-containing protein [Chloroflexi bacterium]|nr:PD40 domain-containing protein [Chloroflexota bacterium]